MEILFQDIELFVSVAPSSVSVSRRYATVQKGDKLIEKLLQYGYYQVLDKETLQIIQTHKVPYPACLPFTLSIKLLITCCSKIWKTPVVS